MIILMQIISAKGYFIMTMDLFLNDYYRLLKLLYDNQTVVLDKKVVPLTQMEICSVLKMSKVKVNTIFVELQKEGLLIQETRGKYSLTDKACAIVDSIEKINQL